MRGLILCWSTEADDYERQCRCGALMPNGGVRYPDGWASGRDGRSFCPDCMAEHRAVMERLVTSERPARQRRFPSRTRRVQK